MAKKGLAEYPFTVVKNKGVIMKKSEQKYFSLKISDYDDGIDEEYPKSFLKKMLGQPQFFEYTCETPVDEDVFEEAMASRIRTLKVFGREPMVVDIKGTDTFLQTVLQQELEEDDEDADKGDVFGVVEYGFQEPRHKRPTILRRYIYSRETIVEIFRDILCKGVIPTRETWEDVTKKVFGS